METTSNKKTLWIVIAVVIIVLLAWWALSSKKAIAPVNENTATTADIHSQLSGLNDTDLNAEFQSVDADSAALSTK